MPDYSDLISLVRGQAVRPPLPAIWDFAPCHAGAVGGIPDMVEYYFDIDTKMETQLRLKQIFPQALILPGVFPDLGVIVEVSAFGGQVLFFGNGAPYINPVLRSIEEVDRLKAPRPGQAGLTPVFLAQRRMMERRLGARGRDLERYAMSMGPAEVCGLLLGYEQFYLAIHDDPRRLHALMTLVTDFILSWLELQDRSMGGAEVILVADHVLHQVRPEQLEEFILPYERAIYAAFPQAIKIYHNEGRHTPEHVRLILKLGVDVWHFGSDVHPIRDMLDQVGDRLVLFGGLNPHGVMRHGGPAEVAAETRAAVEAARGRRLLLSTGTGTTPEATRENLAAMVEAALA